MSNPTNNGSPDELANLKAKRSLDKSEASVHEGEYTCAVCRPLIAELAAHKHTEVTGLPIPSNANDGTLDPSVNYPEMTPGTFTDNADGTSNFHPQQGSESTKLDDILQELREALREAPGIDTDIGFSRWYDIMYQTAKAKLLEWRRQEADKNLMTGREWFDRFEKELGLDWLSDEYQATILAAAKRAANLTTEVTDPASEHPTSQRTSSGPQEVPE